MAIFKSESPLQTDMNGTSDREPGDEATCMHQCDRPKVASEFDTRLELGFRYAMFTPILDGAPVCMHPRCAPQAGANFDNFHVMYGSAP